MKKYAYMLKVVFKYPPNKNDRTKGTFSHQVLHVTSMVPPETYGRQGMWHLAQLDPEKEYG